LLNPNTSSLLQISFLLTVLVSSKTRNRIKKEFNLTTKLNEIIAAMLHIPLEGITDQLTMSEVETWDSLQHMSLIASLEQEFGVELTFEEIVSMQSVAEIKHVLRGKGVAI
jgi:acyl carrier protein